MVDMELFLDGVLNDLIKANSANWGTCYHKILILANDTLTFIYVCDRFIYR